MKPLIVLLIIQMLASGTWAIFFGAMGGGCCGTSTALPAPFCNQCSQTAHSAGPPPPPVSHGYAAPPPAPMYPLAQMHQLAPHFPSLGARSGYSQSVAYQPTYQGINAGQAYSGQQSIAATSYPQQQSYQSLNSQPNYHHQQQVISRQGQGSMAAVPQPYQQQQQVQQQQHQVQPQYQQQVAPSVESPSYKEDGQFQEQSIGLGRQSTRSDSIAASGDRLQPVEPDDDISDASKNGDNNSIKSNLLVEKYVAIDPIPISDLKMIDDPLCNNNQLRNIIDENIGDDLNNSKRLIQLTAEAQFGGQFDVICSRNDFSYLTNTELYCQYIRDEVSCYAYRQL